RGAAVRDRRAVAHGREHARGPGLAHLARWRRLLWIMTLVAMLCAVGYHALDRQAAQGGQRSFVEAGTEVRRELRAHLVAGSCSPGLSYVLRETSPARWQGSVSGS